MSLALYNTLVNELKCPRSAWPSSSAAFGCQTLVYRQCSRGFTCVILVRSARVSLSIMRLCALGDDACLHTKSAVLHHALLALRSRAHSFEDCHRLQL